MVLMAAEDLPQDLSHLLAGGEAEDAKELASLADLHVRVGCWSGLLPEGQLGAV